MENHFEVYTMTNKAKRDEMFDQFRESRDPYERQAVKFSGVQEVPNEDNSCAIFTNPLSRGRWKWVTRKVYQSTWSVAYPTERG